MENISMKKVSVEGLDSVFTKGEAVLNNVINLNNRLNEGVGQFRTCVALTDVKATLSTAFSDFKKQLKDAKAELKLNTTSDGELRLELDVKVDLIPENLRKGYEAATGLVDNISKIIRDTPDIKRQVEELSDSLKALTPDKLEADVKGANLSAMETVSAISNAKGNVEKLGKTPSIFEQLVATCQDAAKQIQEGFAELKQNAQANVDNAKAAVTSAPAEEQKKQS